MTTAELFLQEFDQEVEKTRSTLERVSSDKRDFVPHAKSMPLGRLAALVAQLPEFGVIVLTTPALDFAAGSFAPLQFESAAQLVRALDAGATTLRAALKNTDERAWTEPWKLTMKETTFFAGSRFLAYRQMFLNHLIHHRAQLGVYLRMTDTPVPAIYGPSADERA
jgi:uncharacterized damage-inducible protein DinB